MHHCYYCPMEFPTMWVFRNHVDEHHKQGDHNRPCSCGKDAHRGCWRCPDTGAVLPKFAGMVAARRQRRAGR